jgi:2,4-dienoyl-CoA reductase-like NADH-dependent reductase (Old Yellow Enzyme family)
MADLFTPLSVGDVELRNRVMVSPMCQYCCETDGLATEWHHVHLGSRAVGGAGLVMSEAAAVQPEGRITPHDLGIWSDDHSQALARTAAFVADHGAVPGVQLAHAGRKASRQPPRKGRGPATGDRAWTPVGPTDAPYPDEETVPTEALTGEGIDELVEAFRAAAARASAAGFEVAEVHGAHGYLLHEFLSPVTNTREDEYGGGFEGRTRLVREVCEAVREAFDGSVFLRLSATDWLPDRDSWTVEDTARLAARVAEAGTVDLVDVSAGGLHPDQQVPDARPHYQVPYAERVGEALAGLDCAVGAVGKITTPEGADEIISNSRADLAILAREHLRDPYFSLHAASELGAGDRVDPPTQYHRGFPDL